MSQDVEHDPPTPSDDEPPDDGAVGDLPEEGQQPEEHTRRRSLRRRSAAAEDEEREERITARLSHQLAHQWTLMREERKHAVEPVTAGPSNFSRAEVPWGMDLAAAWAWRFVVIAAAGYLILWLVAYFAVITIPLAVALLITALASPLVRLLSRVLPRGLATILVMIAGIAAVAALLTYAGQQIASGANDLADSTVQGLGEVKDWLKNGPLHATDSQINEYIERAQAGITDAVGEGDVVGRVTELSSTVGHVLAGLFIVLFSTYFFLADGERIWAWLVRLSPRAARERVDSSGRVAWISLTQFVRATVIVALTDAIGIAVGAAILQVPFVLAIGVLVFLGAFIPMVGATIAGTVAVLVALVDQGPVTALLMLAVVIGVQQLEGHVLQPFLLGRWVSVHPLGVILAIGAGVLVAGVAGALVAVPLAAALNAVVQHLATFTAPGDDPEEALAEDYQGSSVPVEDADDV